MMKILKRLASKSFSGEVSDYKKNIKREAPLAPTVDPKKPGVLHRWERARTEEATKLTQARKNFMSEWGEYQEEHQRVQNIDKRLAAVDEEETQRLNEAKAANAQLQRDLKNKALGDDLAEANLQANIAEAKARQKTAEEKLSHKQPDESERLEQLRKRKEREHEEQVLKDKFYRKNKVREAGSKYDLIKEYDEECDRRINAVYAKARREGRKPTELTAQEELEIDNATDYFNNMKAGL